MALNSFGSFEEPDVSTSSLGIRARKSKASDTIHCIPKIVSRKSTPRREYGCPDCGLKFKASTSTVSGMAGKRCPAGHWNSMYALKRYEQSGFRPVTKRVVTVMPSSPEDPRAAQLAVALRFMLEGYDKAVRAMPKGSQARALVEGAFGHMPGLAREVLEGGL